MTNHKPADPPTDETSQAEHIAELKAQRDEARRLYCCLWEAHRLGDGTAEARKRGWDCFSQLALDRLANLDEECGL